MPDIVIRAITPANCQLLADFCFLAIHLPDGGQPPPRAIIYEPELAKYFQAWGKDGDLGFASSLSSTHAPIAAAWLRLYDREKPGYGYIDDHTPELSIAVLPSYRGQGIGTRLLSHLCDQAKHSYQAISLSVIATNPAVRLYQRLGFVQVSDRDGALTMRKQLH
jgi:ribosomal protein S18 acetylase RimI-like enzyme